VRWLCAYGPCKTKNSCAACGNKLNEHIKINDSASLLPLSISITEIKDIPKITDISTTFSISDLPENIKNINTSPNPNFKRHTDENPNIDGKVNWDQQVKCEKHNLCTFCKTQSVVCPVCIFEKMPRIDGWVHSTKTQHLLKIIQKHVLKPKEKCILFSQWTTCLDLLEIMFDASNIKYCRFDGSINGIEERREAVSEFSAKKDLQVMLTSLGAGGEGIDLTCATVVILMEPYWNHAIEKQAVDRIHRLGQTKPVKVFKLHLKNSVEEWVLQLQGCKLIEQKYYLNGVVPKAQNREKVMHSLPAHARQNGTLKKLVKRQEKLAPSTSTHPKNSWKYMVDIVQYKQFQKHSKKRRHSAISSTLDVFIDIE
jgi:SNF2 family DNA or RNA helicase